MVCICTYRVGWFCRTLDNMIATFWFLVFCVWYCNRCCWSLGGWLRRWTWRRLFLSLGGLGMMLLLLNTCWLRSSPPENEINVRIYFINIQTQNLSANKNHDNLLSNVLKSFDCTGCWNPKILAWDNDFVLQVSLSFLLIFFVFFNWRLEEFDFSLVILL